MFDDTVPTRWFPPEMINTIDYCDIPGRPDRMKIPELRLEGLENGVGPDWPG
jgi:hypothetical protein